MIRPRRLFALPLIATFAAALLSIAPSAQSHAANSRTRAVADVRGVRDLAPAAPESVGIAPDRLKRLDAAMKRLADDRQVAGLVTLLARHGKIVHFDAVGRRDVRATDPLQKD